jgi:hypothetical protein
MALPSSGVIGFSDVNIEIGNTSNALITLNDANVRTVFGQTSGQIDMNTGHGKSVFTQFAFSAYGFTTNGVDASGGGPISAPGTIRPTSGAFAGQSVAVPVALTLMKYWANSGGASQTYQSPTDSVFVSSTTNWTATDLINLGINYTTVRSTSTAITLDVVFDVDQDMSGGYYIITRSGAVTSLSLWATGTYTAAYSAQETGGGRQRNIPGSWTLPALNANQLLVPAWNDGTGTNNLRWSFT